MRLNNKKIISIILEQCGDVEERCNGYREEIVQVIAEILEYERGHRVSRTDIQKKINDQFNATAQFLVKGRKHGVTPMERSHENSSC